MTRVIIVGGYGHVGRRLALHTRHASPDLAIVLAGRRPDAAARTAAELGVDAGPSPIDFRTGEGLEKTAHPGDLVVNAAGDDADATLLRACMELGLHYADLTAHREALSAMLDLGSEARESGISALVGIGLAPGATNVLARSALDAAGRADRIDVGLLLSVSDGFGPAAVDWTLHTIADPAVDAFSDHEVMPFGTLGQRRVYSFGFPEQYFLPGTLGVPEARGWFGLTPAAAGRAVAWMGRRRPVRAALGRPSTRARVVRLAGRLPDASGRAPVAATAIARRGHATFEVSLRGRSESDTTALCAAALLDCWNTAEHGVHLPESVIEPHAFLKRLSAAGLQLSGNALPPTPGDAQLADGPLRGASPQDPEESRP